MTKYKKHPWPTNGATMKFVEKHVDSLTRRLDRQGAKIIAYRVAFNNRLKFLETVLMAVSPEAWDHYNANYESEDELTD